MVEGPEFGWKPHGSEPVFGGQADVGWEVSLHSLISEPDQDTEPEKPSDLAPVEDTD